MYKGYKVRLFPTPEQEELMWKHVYAKRFLWNKLIEIQRNAYRDEKKYFSKFDMIKMLPDIKKENPWLKEVGSHTLSAVCSDVDYGYQMFFKGIKKIPKFKTRKIDKNAFPVRREKDSIKFIDNEYVKIPKLGKIKYRCSYNVNPTEFFGVLKPQIHLENEKWILSFVVECENQAHKFTGKRMGIDLGVKNLMVVSYDGEKIVFGNINKSKRMKNLEKKKKKLDKVIMRKYKSNPLNLNIKGAEWEKSKNIEKYERIRKKLCKKQANIRKDYIHKITSFLVSLSPDIVVMENLKTSNLLKNKWQSKSISECCWFEIRKIMQYKCENNGIDFILADTFYPSSKICSACGNVGKKLKLSERTYVCEKCGFEIDRDYNAAINLMNYNNNQSGK